MNKCLIEGEARRMEGRERRAEPEMGHNVSQTAGNACKVHLCGKPVPAGKERRALAQKMILDVEDAMEVMGWRIETRKC